MYLWNSVLDFAESKEPFLPFNFDSYLNIIISFL